MKPLPGFTTLTRLEVKDLMKEINDVWMVHNARGYDWYTAAVKKAVVKKMRVALKQLDTLLSEKEGIE